MQQHRLAQEIADMPAGKREDDDRVEPINGDGSTRLAYRILEGSAKGKVLKIAMLNRAKKENRREMQTWMRK